MQLAFFPHMRLFSSCFNSDTRGKDKGVVDVLFIISDDQRSQGSKSSHAREFN